MYQITTEALGVGQWLLMGITQNPGDRPTHGVKFKFCDKPGGLRGAIVNWETGGEIALARLDFDGSVLEIQMTPDDDYQVENPTLAMKLEGKQFEGYWMSGSGNKLLDRKLKLVQYKTLAKISGRGSGACGSRVGLGLGGGEAGLYGFADTLLDGVDFLGAEEAIPRRGPG